MLIYTAIFVTNGNLHVYDEFMPAKLIKAASYNIAFFFTVYVVFAVAEYLSITLIYKVLNITLWALIFYGIIQAIFNVHIPFINGTESSETARIYLTAPEPSIAAPFFVTLSLTVIALRLYLHKPILLTAVTAGLSLLIVILIGSKGVLVLLPVALVIAIRKKLTVKVIFLATLILIPLTIVVIYKVIPMLAMDLEGFNSISTRSTTWLAAFESLFIYPLGEGYGTYLVYFPPMLVPANHQITNVTGIPLLTFEIDSMIETGKYLGAKSGIANQVLNNGFLAVIFTFLVSKHYLRLKKKVNYYSVQVVFSIIGIFLLVSFLFTTSLENAYYYLLPFVALDKIVLAKKESIAAL